MKAELVTFFHIHHYGAVLQAAATERALRSLGWDCEIPDYYVNQNNALFRAPLKPSAAAADAHTALHYRALRERYDRFERFAARHLTLTRRHYETREALAADPPACDVLISGSDQIWNPRIYPDGRFDPAYFGFFTPARKIAYAPSFGIPRLTENERAELRGYLAGYSHLSAREVSGQEIISDAAGRGSALVLDPTLLLTRSDWEAMSALRDPSLPKRYILCYCISKPDVLIPYLHALMRHTGLPVVQLCGIRTPVVKGARTVLSAGPAEFLSLFRDAEAVVTNSFHGTVFSLQFEKPFYTAVAPKELAAPERSRIMSLLDRCGLKKRVAGLSEAAAAGDAIDWAGVEQRLARERGASLAYLKAALEDRPFEVPADHAGSTAAAAPESADVPLPPALAQSEKCSGCAACAAVCPHGALQMQPDREGFLRPQIDPARCVGCGRCASVCPALHPRTLSGEPAAFAVWHEDDAIRRDSTSGGAFTAIAGHILEQGGVVCAAAFDPRMVLRHGFAFKPEELARMRGAKYVQSDVSGVYPRIREFLKTRPVLFCGTPCEVEGLYRYLGEKPEELTTCDLICSGVPSPGVWSKWIAQRSAKKKKNILSVRFRDKVTSWQASHLTLTYTDGSIDSKPLFQSGWGYAFGRNLMQRRACYTCPYACRSRVGDFTLGDLWGLSKDELREQQKAGVSLLLVNNAHASRIFDVLPLKRVAWPMERAAAGNPRLESPPPESPDRAAFYAAFAFEPFEQVRKKYLCAPSPLRGAARALVPEAAKARIKKILRRG